MKRLTRLLFSFMLIVAVMAIVGGVVSAQDDDEDNFTAQDYFDRGLEYYEVQEYALASTDFNSALELDPEFADAYFYRALTSYYLGITDQQMIDDVNNAIEYGFDRLAWAHNTRGLAYLGMDEYELALADFETALEISSTYRTAIQNIGSTYAQMGDWISYIATYKQIGADFGMDERYYNGMAWAYVQLGRGTSALRFVNASLEINPNYFGAIDTRGWAYLILDEYELAEADFLYAIEEGDEYYSYYGLGALYAELGDIDQAIEYLELHIELEGNSADPIAIELLAELQGE